MKKVLIALTLGLMLMVATTVVLAGPKDYDKKAEKGQYYLVAKDPDNNWAILPKAGNPWAKAKFDIDCDDSNTLTMRIKAHGLVLGDWYFVELVDKTSGYDVIDVLETSRRSRFYGQANPGGVVDMTFSWDISGHNNIEVNMKNADNVALLDPSTYGVPSEWILGTGQGWSYVLYGATTIPNACS